MDFTVRASKPNYEYDSKGDEGIHPREKASYSLRSAAAIRHYYCTITSTSTSTCIKESTYTRLHGPTLIDTRITDPRGLGSAHIWIHICAYHILLPTCYSS